MNFRPLFKTALYVFVSGISLRLTIKSRGCRVFAICLLSFLLHACLSLFYFFLVLKFLFYHFPKNGLRVVLLDVIDQPQICGETYMLEVWHV